MAFLKIVRGQERASRLLGRSLSGGRLAHAYLFAGPSGVGRLTAALELAAAKMCQNGGDSYCGKCRDCARVFHFQHPDVMLTIPRTGSTEPESVADLMEARAKDGITPLRLEGNTRISIQQVRELQERLSTKAYEDRGHVEIILDADRMGVEAANSLLKTLEEPPADTVLMLLSSRWSALLPTVRSRTQLIRFRRLEERLIRDILMQRLDIGAEEAEELARISDGRPGLALSRSGGTGREDTAFGPSAIIRKIEKCDSVSGTLSLASEVSRKLGTEGSLEFCRDMQTFLHDLRRREIGMRPLSHSSRSTEGFGLSEDAHSMGMELFRKAEVRLSGNGRAAVVLSAAFSGMWEGLRRSGRGSLQ